jgi:molecular chaperone DnaK (HSP70)
MVWLWLHDAHLSSVAWALQSSPDDVEVITLWPGARNSELNVLKSRIQELILAGTTPKVPTTISYENGKLLWGYQTPMFGEVIRGVKLLLDPTQEIDYTPAVQSKEILAKYDKQPVDVARDYLQLLVTSAKETLRRRFGNALDSMEIRYVLTVPAVWTDKAKNATLTAATDAGISALDVTLVSEPEAAALSCLDAIQPNTIEVSAPARPGNSTLNIYQNGDVVIICDAGGGTVVRNIQRGNGQEEINQGRT